MGDTELLLRSIRYQRPSADGKLVAAAHPFNLALLQAFDQLTLTSNVTFLVGDNGCGKSTLLNGIAASAALPIIGEAQAAPLSEQTPHPGTQLAKQLTLVKSRPLRHGCYFRADQVALFVRGIEQGMAEHADMVGEFANIKGDWGRDRAQGIARSEQQAFSKRYGADPTARSHGELYLNLLKQRITARGLYLLDEPETPLSPTNQLAFIALLLEAVTAHQSQFIIATHSPIVLAYPGATIFDCNGSRPETIDWAQTEHVSLTRGFLNNPQQYLRHFIDPLHDDQESRR